VRKCRIEHDTCRVYHRQLVNELPWIYANVSVYTSFAASTTIERTFQRRMETETTKSDKKVAKICNNEDIVMFILHTVVNAFESEVEEHEVGKRVDDFRRVRRGIVILRSIS